MCCARLAGNAGPTKSLKIRHLGTIAQIRPAISSQLRHISTIGKILVKQQCLPHISSQYGELRPTSGWDLLASLGQPCKYQPVSRLGSVTARHATGVSQTLRRWTEGATYTRQGGHHVGHWPTFLVIVIYCRVSDCVRLLDFTDRLWLCYRCEHYIFVTWFLLILSSFFFFVAQLCRAISSQLRHMSTMGKNLLSSNMSCTCPHNMVNFGPLAAEVCLASLGHPCKLLGFRVLSALLHGTLVVGVSQTLRRWTCRAQISDQMLSNRGTWVFAG